MTRVVICGSLAHPDLIAGVVDAEETAGRDVIAYPTDEGMPADEAAALWRHLIAHAEEVVAVQKPDGTLGKATRAELAFAAARGKQTRIVRAHEDGTER